MGAIEDVRQRKKKKAALDQVEKNKFALLGEKSRMFFQKKKEAQAFKFTCELSPFVGDSIHSRLNMIEINTLMSDYRSAYHVAHQLFVDFKIAD